MNNSMTRACFAACLALPLVATAADPAFESPFTIQVSAFRPEARTKVRLDADLQPGRIGTELSLENDLAMEKTKTLPEIEFLWRINPRHAIEASWVSLKRSGSTVATATINWGDVTFPISSQLDSQFDSDVYRVAWRWSPVHEPDMEISTLLGAHYTKVFASISSTLGTRSDSASVDFPLPTLGARGIWYMTPSVRINAFGQFLKLKINDYDGALYNGAVGVEWAFMRNAFAGIGYDYYRYKLTSEKEQARGTIDYRFDGPRVYAAWSF